MDPRELEIEKGWLLDARNDPEAFMFFYEKYYDRIFRLCYHQVSDYEFAEDLVSETFLRAQERLPYFHWQGLTMGAWLYRIAGNQIKYRRRNRLRTTDLDDVDDGRTAEFEDPLDALVMDEEQLRVTRLIRQLDPDQRDVIRMHYWEGLTIREIAVVLDRPEGTIKARLKRGRDRLAAMIEAEKRAESRREGRPSPDDRG